MDLLKAFNNHFIEFVDAVAEYFNDHLEIKTASNALRAMRKANPKLIVSIWKDSVITQYQEQIEAGDIEFFVTKEYGSDVENMGNSSSVLESIDKLRGPIQTMPAEDQKKCMKYIQNLTKLCNLYYLNRN